MAKVAIQGGVKNYLPSKEVTVPKKAKSSKNHPTTELAYITEAEKNLLIKKDLHNSLNGKPNRGPGGIMSLNGQYDGGPDRSPGNTGNTDSSGNDRNDPPSAPSNNFRETSNITNTTGGPRATGPSYSVARDAKGNPFTGSGGPDLIDGRPEAEVVRDLIKAQAIYNYKPNKLLNVLPYLSTARNFFGTPFTKGGKKRTASRRMEYINSLPPEQKKAMIERLGIAEDDDYDENDVFDSNYDKDFNRDLTSIYGEGINTLSNDPLSYQGETPLYGIDAYDIVNYDGEFLKRYGQEHLTDPGGDEIPLPYYYNQDDDTEEEDTGPEYRFGTGQDVIYDDYGKAGYRTTRAADGGIMGTRARRAMGGIMNRVDKRQGYFLGKLVSGIGDAIGGVADAAGKVLKSDLGKYAIMAAGMYYGGGGGMPKMFGGSGLGGFKASTFFSKANPLLFNADKTLSLSKLAGISTALPFLMPAAKPNETSFSDRGGSLIDPITGEEATPAEMRENIELAKLEAGNDPDKLAAIDAKYNNMLNLQYQAGLPDATPYNLYGSSGYRTTRAATGGRMGFNNGGTTITLMDGTTVKIPSGSYNSSGSLKDKIYSSSKGDLLREEIVRKLSFANGGRIGKAEGGLMDLGGMEKDYRAEGGFVPIGEYEKKDDVPARLSVNEFVMTADAVRGAGQGDIDKGAEIMENMMKNLENGGTVSEESQGNKGAQNMFKTSERLGAII